MKKSLLALSLFSLFVSCNFSKVATLDIENRNNYPVSISVEANNVKQVFGPIAPHKKMQDQFNWTDLNKEEGQFIFRVENMTTHMKDSFSHGFIRNGELYNYISLIAEGSELKVEISN